MSLHTVVKKKASSIQIVWLSGVKQRGAQVIIHSIDISVKREQQLQKIRSIHQASGEMQSPGKRKKKGLKTRVSKARLLYSCIVTGVFVFNKKFRYMWLQKSQIYLSFLNEKVNNDRNKNNSYVFPPGYVGLTEAPFPNRNRTVSTRLPLKTNTIGP